MRPRIPLSAAQAESVEEFAVAVTGHWRIVISVGRNPFGFRPVAVHVTASAHCATEQGALNQCAAGVGRSRFQGDRSSNFAVSARP